MLRTVAAAGLWLVSTAALAESLWLEPTAALADKRSDCLGSRDHHVRIEGCSAIIQHSTRRPAADSSGRGAPR